MKRSVSMVLMILLALSLPATGQEAPAAPQPVDRAALQKQISDLAANDAIDETLKTQLAEIYQQTLQALTAGDAFRVQADTFRAQLENAPAQVMEIEARLAQAVEAVTVEISEGITAMDLELEVARARMELAAAQTHLEELEAEATRRADRRQELPQLLAESRARRAQTESQQSAVSANGGADPLVAAHGLLARARLETIRAEILAYEQEFLSYEVRGRLLTLRQDLARRQLADQERRVRAWQDAASEFRRRESIRAAQEAREALMRASAVGPRIREFAETFASENSALIQRRTGPDGTNIGIDRATRAITQTEEVLKQVQSDFETIRNRIETASAVEALGPMLRSQLINLPSSAALTRDRQSRATLIASVQAARLDLRVQRTALAEPERIVSDLVGQLDAGVSETDREKLREILLEQVKAKRDTMDVLLTDYENYLQKLSELDAREGELSATVEEFRDYIAERALWIRSTDPVSLSDLSIGMTGLNALVLETPWERTGPYMANDIKHNWALYLLGLLPLLIRIIWFRSIARHLRAAGEESAKKYSSNIRPTFDALGISIWIAASIPLVLALVGWRLAQPIQDITALHACGVAFQGAALVWFMLRFFRQLTRPGGVGEKHFGWPAKGCLRIRRHILWLVYFWLPLVAAVLFWGAIGSDVWPQAIGRLFFIVALILSGLFAAAILRAQQGGLSILLELDEWPSWRRTSVFIIVLLELFFLGLAAAAIQGYFFTAVRLGQNAFLTISTGFLIFVLFSFGSRWILVIKRRLHREQRKKRLQATSENASVDESLLEQEAIYRIDEQTRSLLRTVCVVSLFVLTGFIWSQELPALRALDNVEVWSTTSAVTETVLDEEGNSVEVTEPRKVPITLLGLGGAILVAAVGFLIIRNVPGLLEIAILRFTAIGPGERYAITTLTTYVLIVAITVWTIGTLGVAWSQVQWLVAALSLGLGFGLQEIFANFVSGIIVLFERPVRVGDVITVSGHSGTVTKIQIRATTIRDFDRKELIIPNKELVTGQLLNWSLSDAMLRIVVPVGMAYGSDTDKAEELLWEILNNHPFVAKDPAPRVLFLQFGDNTLNYDVQAHCSSIDNVMTLRHQLHKQIDKAFREAGIEIAFPQRDLHIKEPIQIVYSRKP